MHRFKDLEIWKLSRKFCSDIYIVTSNFPDSEKFGLTNQLRRASVSVPSNIAEGCSRSSNKDLSRFLEIAIGSIYEIETQILIAFDLGYIEQIKLDELCFNIDKIVKMTSKFRSTLQ
ncbi:four helix bundle protein [Flavobacterium psychrotolerans]|uniref:Diversity-generating retroelement protein bAvd family protein n=1 Tax=Flavobacterium psychrotolerans TaxID=2169410 RepID=A0A2U1JI95_9FLAO|nr:four helix bundle protein [Flavobacterium psychrotolerans]PWA04709.1 diversity-generating retroelement protein bAvd family protein [Flavobacterium psychrotolerans]